MEFGIYDLQTHVPIRFIVLRGRASWAVRCAEVRNLRCTRVDFPCTSSRSVLVGGNGRILPWKKMAEDLMINYGVKKTTGYRIVLPSYELVYIPH